MNLATPPNYRLGPGDSEVAFTLSSDGTAYEAVAAGDGGSRR